jgi:hypothetical protein
MLSDHLNREIAYLICDKEIGRGMSRVTYSSRVLPDCVIKCEGSGGHFQNQLEWEIWNTVWGTSHEKWFAPCEWISPCGSVLIMKKTVVAAKYPEKMPAYLSDFKKNNYGMYNGHIVCHDYGTCMVVRCGLTKRMIKVREWYEN